MEKSRRKELEENLHGAVLLEAKARSALAEELTISDEEVAEVAASLADQCRLEEVTDDPEPTYKGHLHAKTAPKLAGNG